MLRLLFYEFFPVCSSGSSAISTENWLMSTDVTFGSGFGGFGHFFLG
ncbi:hypothetical protein HFO24_05000 [Rhizobium laguerreae]|nr:hypothetical protein [Rhizobium laguerreae]MBY3181029.1 hypothetical protein [Rhizobium laguerreae]